MPPARDLGPLRVETPDAPHVGAVHVLDGSRGTLDEQRLRDVLAARLAYAPRYRQRMLPAPGGIGAPSWTSVDVDLDHHVRRAAVPRPGTDEQLGELVARVQSRPLDPTRPLWEVYLVEGLEHGRCALVTKTHPALAEGPDGVDPGQLLFDGDLAHRAAGAGGAAGSLDEWSQAREPGPLALLTAAALGAVRDPGRLAGAVRAGSGLLAGVAAGTARGALGVGGALWHTLARPRTVGPRAVATSGTDRRFVLVGVDLDTARAARDRHQGRAAAGDDHVSVHDVILTALTGALRTCLENRGVVLDRADSVRALVPVGVRDGLSRTAVPSFVDLPVGEPAPAVRLYQVAYQTRRQVDADLRLGAATLSGLAGAGLHAAGARVAAAVTRRLFDLVVVDVPGLQDTLTVDGHPMVSTFPVVPLPGGQALAVGVSSYDGGLFVGLHADRDAMPDVALLGAAFVDALAELAQP